jgi:hypothetical protein
VRHGQACRRVALSGKRPVRLGSPDQDVIDD